MYIRVDRVPRLRMRDGHCVVIRTEDTAEEELVESSSVEISVDNRTLVDHVAVLHGLILPLHGLADIKPRGKTVDAIQLGRAAYV